jgi:DNA invertase Pin-like site-specific DNA recombinase
METSTVKKGQRVAYVRVSTIEQNVGRQLEGLIADKIFTDHKSGKNTDRPALQEALAYVREGDTLVCFSMDRLARKRTGSSAHRLGPEQKRRVCGILKRATYLQRRQ